MCGDHRTAEKLMKRYAMSAHPENGAFVENHYPDNGPGRADSGSIYYYVAPNEHTCFHRIDCDEYWCWICGTPLEVWSIDPEGTLKIRKLGIEDDCAPMLYLKKGMIFASRHGKVVQDGTFITCITVPRFTYDGFEMFDREQVLSLCPAAGAFFE